MAQPSQTQKSGNAGNVPYKQPFIHQFVAGGIAGVAEILVMYPTDVVKTRAQLATTKQPNMFAVLGKIVREEGLTRLYRGILPPIMVEAPKRAVKFSSNETYKPYFKNKEGVLTTWGGIGAGVLAGITEAFVVVPFELVKIRLQDKNNVGKYKGTLDAVIKIMRNEGILAFYKGLEATLWRHATWNGGYFGVINFIQRKFPKTEDRWKKLLNNFVAGAIAGTFGTMLNTPPDVVKSRIQNQVIVPGQKPKYSWTIPSLVMIAREEGILALYKGFVPKVVRLGPGGGILLVVFDYVSKLLRDWDIARKHKS
jgi:solute carrier family 25 2-oxodicarboxylate transporter 21